MNVASRLLFPLALLAASSGLLAQDAIEPYVEYRKRVEAAQNISPLQHGLFGEQVSLYNGSTAFSVTDIDVPGNNALPVQLTRRFSVELQPQNLIHSYDALLRGMGNWDVDVPHMAATYLVSAGAALRCDGGYVPSGAPQGFHRGDIWQGVTVNVPGRGSMNALGMLAELPRPTGGATYKLTTPDRDVFECIPMKPGFTGQGFRMTTVSGLRYYFDTPTTRTAATLEGLVKLSGQMPLTVYAPRNRLYLLASKIEDRFGNTVEFQYNANGHPTRIWSNDDREITLTYTSGRLATAASQGRTWHYRYTHAGSGLYARLSEVERPDHSTWKYTYSSDLMPPPDGVGVPPLPWCAGFPLMQEDSLVLTSTHPSGAVGTFEFNNRRHSRSGVHVTECERTGDLYDPSYRLRVPHFFDVMSIDSKTLSGPGLEAQEWTYGYASHLQSLWGLPTEPPSYPCTTCTASKTVTVTHPDASATRYTFGMRYHDNDGRQLKVETLRANTTVARSETSTYMTEAQAAAQPFHGLQGSNLGGIGDPASVRQRPVTNRTIQQDGVNFIWQANTFDTFARPKRVTRSSTLPGNPTRQEETFYWDNMVKWVLGQVHRAVCIGPSTALPAGCGGGTEMFKRSYDPTYALPLVTERFGKIEQTLAWNTAAPLPGGQRGTAASVADGNGHATTLADWKHGIPQLITYPATPEAPSGATHAAHVNDRGWIDWIDDENGSRTCYLYDAMGRISQVTYPSESSAHVCNTSTWAATTQAFQQVDSTEYGIPAGHWRQTVATGNGRRVSYFDALWRPLVTREYDTANPVGTQRFQRFAYDHEGRTTFASYPATAHNPTTGSWTEYDALGRATSVSQDSEQGLLTTTTLYEPGFQTRVTNAENHQTLTRYLAWDQPTTDFPIHVTHPEGAFTHITRDVFGKPTLLRRSNHTNPAGGTLAVNRTYAYNQYQELCRSVEPETGATLMGYDGAGNLAWSAAGLPAATACTLTGASPAISARRVDRTYDARSRLKTLSFPKDSNGNGNGDQAWTYFPDGKPHQISTWNIGVEGGDPKETRNLYGYHRRGLLITEAIAVPAWYMFLVGHAYDANGHEIQLTYPSGRVVTAAVNALGQPTAITSAGATYASGIGYHPNGAVAGFTYGNGIVHAMAPNARQLPGMVSSVYGAEEFLHDGYAYDRNANVTAIADLRLGKGGARSRTMTYDGLDRLTSVASEMYGPTGANYVYNVLDDLTQVNVGGPTGRNHHYCYNAKRQLGGIRSGSCSGTSLFTLQFDAQGNLQSRAPTGGTAQTYRFDFGNRLREVDGVERYRYDGHGRRVLAMQIDAGTVFSQYGLDGRLLYQKSEKTGLQTDHIFLGGTLVAIQEKPSVGAGPEPVKYQHTDALGSPVVVTRQDRSRVEESEYEPYGLVINRPGRDGPGYTGHVEDAATGLVYMQQRYFDPEVGQFLSTDPVTAYTNPVGQFHRYRYANNNPYTLTDPDGRQADGDNQKTTGSHLRRSETARAMLSNGATAHSLSSTAAPNGSFSSGAVYSSRGDAKSAASSHNSDIAGGEWQSFVFGSGYVILIYEEDGSFGYSLAPYAGGVAPGVGWARAGSLGKLFGRQFPTKANRGGVPQPYNPANGEYLPYAANPGLNLSPAARFTAGVVGGYVEAKSNSPYVPIGRAGSWGHMIGLAAGVVF